MSTDPKRWVAGHIATLPKSGIRDFFERTLRQHGMVFKYKFRDRAIFLAGQTYEAHNAARFLCFASECCQLRRGIESPMLNDRAHHPPETTGMNSTERSGLTIAPSAVIIPSTQARTR